MKKLIPILILFVLFAGACKKTTTQVKQVIPKPTEKGAEKFVKKYWSLMNKLKYEKNYELLSPQDQKLVSKKTFIDARKEDKTNYKVEVGPVVLDGRTAKATLFFNTPLGRQSSVDKIIFVGGRWYQKLEQDSLISHGVNPSKIAGIKQATIGEQFSIPAFSATIKGVNKDKTITGEFGNRSTAQGIFIIVDFDVTNTGKQQFSFNADDYMVAVDSESRLFGSSQDSATESFAQINPGMVAQLKVAFDVPEQAKEFSLLVGTENNRYLIPLGI